MPPITPEPRDAKYRNWIFTIPNVICMVRLVGSILLLLLAFNGLQLWFAFAFLVLNISDWIDGWLARKLHQRSDFGARIDSFADAALYGSLLVGVCVMCWETVQHELWWLASALGSYLLTTSAGLAKFGRVPSYHTLAAKRSQPLVLFAALSLLLWGWVWPLRFASLAVAYTNLEATLLTALLNEWKADVPSIWHIMKSREPSEK